MVRSSNGVEPAPAPAPAPAVALPGFRDALDPSRALKVGTHGLPREHVAAVQRERLMDAFVQLVAEKGYESVGIKAICQCAGVAFATFYQQFRSKDRLFLAAYDAGVEILFREAAQASLAGERTPWRRRVDAGLGSFLTTLAANPRFARFFAVEIHKVGQEAQERIDRSFEAAFRLFSGAKPVTGLPIPVEDLAPLVIGGVYTRIYFYICSGRTAELPDLLPVLTEFVVNAFRPARR